MFSYYFLVSLICCPFALSTAPNPQQVSDRDSCHLSAEPDIARSLLQTSHSARKSMSRTEGIGSTAALNQIGYESVVAKCCSLEMKEFIKRVIVEEEKLKVCGTGGLAGMAIWYDCPEDHGTYARLLEAIRQVKDRECKWLTQVEEDCPESLPNCLSFPDAKLQPCLDESPAISTPTEENSPLVRRTAPSEMPPSYKACSPYPLRSGDTCIRGTSGYATGPSLFKKRCMSPYQLGGPGGGPDGPDTVDVQSDPVVFCASRCVVQAGCVGFDVFHRKSGKTRCSLCKDLPNSCLEEDGLTNADKNGQHYYKASGCT